MKRRISSIALVVMLFVLLGASLLTPQASLRAEAASAPRLIDLTITDKVAGGGKVKLTVTLSKTAATDVRVALKSANPEIVSVPGSVVVKKGRKTGETQATTVRVSKRTPVLLTGTLDQIVCDETVAIMPVSLVSVTAPETIASNGTAKVTVRINEPAPSTGVEIRLSSSRPSVLTVPASVTIAPSKQTATFMIDARKVSKNTPVNVTAKLTMSKNVVDEITILPPPATATPTKTATNAPTMTATSVPSATATDVPTMTATSVPSATATDAPTMTATSVPSATATDVPTMTATSLPSATATDVPTMTATSVPSATATATAAPQYLVDFTVLQLPILGALPATVQVCLTDPTAPLVDVNLWVNGVQIAYLDVNQISLSGLLQCQNLLLTGLLNGAVTITADVNGLQTISPEITFAPATVTFTTIIPPVFGTTPATISVCWSNPVPNALLLSSDVVSTNPGISVINVSVLQFTSIAPCQLVVLGTIGSTGDARLKVTVTGIDYYSDTYHFGLPI